MVNSKTFYKSYKLIQQKVNDIRLCSKNDSLEINKKITAASYNKADSVSFNENGWKKSVYTL